MDYTRAELDEAAAALMGTSTNMFNQTYDDGAQEARGSLTVHRLWPKFQAFVKEHYDDWKSKE